MRAPRPPRGSRATLPSATVAVVLAAIDLAACDTSSTPSGTPTGLDSGGADGVIATGDGADEASMGGLGAPDCNGPCCPLPTEGHLCAAADDGQSCPTSTDCPGGLSLSYALACRQGSW